jgi:hypothetical protein
MLDPSLFYIHTRFAKEGTNRTPLVVTYYLHEHWSVPDCGSGQAISRDYLLRLNLHYKCIPCNNKKIAQYNMCF